MAQYYIQEETLKNLGDAVREKTGSSDLMTPGQMVNAILGISGGTIKMTDPCELEILDNGYISEVLGNFNSSIDWYSVAPVGFIGYLQSTGDYEPVFGIITSSYSLGTVTNTSGRFGVESIELSFEDSEINFLIDPAAILTNETVTIRILYI